MENRLNSQLNWTKLSSYAKDILYCSEFYYYALKHVDFTSDLLGMHDGWKLSQVGELAPAESLQGRWSDWVAGLS